ncbi:MAG: hypothetical protein K2L73_03785 [Muribaculaceae bacterium]|nr:hypothetical protein [Muribaculaceae bacterium]
MVSCGGKYDDARLNELCEKYIQEDNLSDSEWKEFDKLFVKGTDEWGIVVDGLIEKLKPGMTWAEAEDMYDAEKKNYSALSRASNIADYVKNDEVRDHVLKTDDRYGDIYFKFADKVREIIVSNPNYDDCNYSDSIEEESEALDEVETYSQEFILTKDGLGPFTLGMSKSDVPSSIPGLYDSTSYNTFNHEEDMDIPLFIHGWMTFSLNGQDRFAITFDDKGKAIQISVQSPEIPTSLGITTASSVEDAAALPGAHVTEHVYIDGYEVDGFTIYCYDGITSIAIGEAY